MASALRATVRAGARLTRPSRSALDITAKAKEQLQALLKAEGHSPEEKALRLGVRTRGCNGMSYTLDWEDRGHKIGTFDEVVNIEPEGIQLVIDSRAVMHVIGTTMDFERTPVQEEFVFLNPNATGVCGCGESFSTEQ